MNFLQLQTELADLHLDGASEWEVGGSKNKQVINLGFEEVYDKIKNSEEVKKLLNPYPRTKITLINNTGSLPVDFDVIDKCSVIDFKTDNELEFSGGRLYDFEITGQRGSKKISSTCGYSELYITYLPIFTPLVNDTDEALLLPAELHRTIVNFALAEYFRKNRDAVETANALQYAQAVLNDKLNSL